MPKDKKSGYQKLKEKADLLDELLYDIKSILVIDEADNDHKIILLKNIYIEYTMRQKK